MEAGSSLSIIPINGGSIHHRNNLKINQTATGGGSSTDNFAGRKVHSSFGGNEAQQ